MCLLRSVMATLVASILAFRGHPAVLATLYAKIKNLEVTVHPCQPPDTPMASVMIKSLLSSSMIACMQRAEESQAGTGRGRILLIEYRWYHAVWAIFVTWASIVAELSNMAPIFFTCADIGILCSPATICSATTFLRLVGDPMTINSVLSSFFMFYHHKHRRLNQFSQSVLCALPMFTSGLTMLGSVPQWNMVHCQDDWWE